MRPTEALALRPLDIDTTAGRARIGRRFVGLDPDTCSLVGRWLRRRSSLGLTDADPLFATFEVGKVGRPLQPQYVRNALTRLAARVDLDGVNARVLRTSRREHLTAAGMPDHLVRAQLGLRRTQPVRPAELVGAMRDRGWLD